MNSVASNPATAPASAAASGFAAGVARLLRTTAGEVGLLLLSALLFALAHPSLASERGLGPVAFIAIAPLFLVLRRAGWLQVVLYGGLYGYVSYALYNYWLATFHPLAIIIVPVVYMGYLLILFPLLKLADHLFPRYGYLVQVLLWVGYELVKSLGFLGYSYGTLGYTQYRWTDFIQVAGVTGVWGVSLLVVMASALVARLLAVALDARAAPWRRGPLARFWRVQRIPVLCWAVLMAANVAYGAAVRNDYQADRHWRVALIQQDIDPWRGGFYAYEKSLDILLRLSDAALREDPDIVIWSETSFVPGIDWHTRHRRDAKRFALVKRLRTYLDRQTVPFVVGNDDGQLERTDEGEVRVDYNAAILFKKGDIVDTYRKIRLVPFYRELPVQGPVAGHLPVAEGRGHPLLEARHRVRGVRFGHRRQAGRALLHADLFRGYLRLSGQGVRAPRSAGAGQHDQRFVVVLGARRDAAHDDGRVPCRREPPLGGALDERRHDGDHRSRWADHERTGAVHRGTT